jgi:hypothetical protein
MRWVARGLAPIAEPRINRYVAPPKASLRPINEDDPEALAAKFEFLGPAEPQDDVQSWEGIAKKLALELALTQDPGRECKVSRRKLRKETLYRMIAKYFDWWKPEIEHGAKSREDIIRKAARFAEVSDRTVETAIAKYSKELYFTDGTMLRPGTKQE